MRVGKLSHYNDNNNHNNNTNTITTTTTHTTTNNNNDNTMEAKGAIIVNNSHMLGRIYSGPTVSLVVSTDLKSASQPHQCPCSQL